MQSIKDIYVIGHGPSSSHTMGPSFASKYIIDKYVDIKELGEFRDEFEKFINSAKNSKNITKFAKKATGVKCINILANIGISSFLLAVALPKLQYLFNKKITGSYLDPGLRK